MSGPPDLVNAATEAVRQWWFKPTLINGDPVEVDTIVTVTFAIGG
jgi:periplasmic protein TonB